jgi:hypothetical protein
MITPLAPAYYVVQATGEAAEMITAVFSPGTMGDIVDVTVLSKEFTNDIEPINELDGALRIIKSGLQPNLLQTEEYNPLYVPMSIDALDDALDVETKGEMVRFTAMNENPFAVKIVEIATEEMPLITATVSYQQFDLPSYDTIMSSQTTRLLN